MGARLIEVVVWTGSTAVAVPRADLASLTVTAPSAAVSADRFSTDCDGDVKSTPSTVACDDGVECTPSTAGGEKVDCAVAVCEGSVVSRVFVRTESVRGSVAETWVDCVVLVCAVCRTAAWVTSSMLENVAWDGATARR